MGTGYIRNDVSNNIANGEVIDAADLDGEFNAVEAAFSSTTGHTHDGTAAEGGSVTVVGPAQDLVVSGTNVNPKMNATLDLGTSALRFKDAFLSGTVTAVTFVGDLTGNASTATKLATARTLSLSGDATGSVTFDGSANADITVNVVNDSHTHDTRYAAKTPDIDEVGAYSFCLNNSGATLSSGAVTLGSNLSRTDTTLRTGGGVPTGTWRCMSITTDGAGGLFQKISN